MTAIREFAPAKINLTLRIEGRQADGYHRLASLTTFANIGDTLTFEPGLVREVVVSGPFASALSPSDALTVDEPGFHDIVISHSAILKRRWAVGAFGGDPSAARVFSVRVGASGHPPLVTFTTVRTRMGP